MSSDFPYPSESGIGNLVLRALETHPRPHLSHFYSSSGGNAGLACVTAAASLHRPATVIVPCSTKPLMITKMLTAGATQVIQTGSTWAEADIHLREEVLAKDQNGVYVPPFDHPHVWAGAGTIIDELVEQLEGSKPSAIICSVGGGGLFSGIMIGLEKNCWTGVDVLAMETIGAESLAESLKKGNLVTLPGITSIATSLGATRVGSKTFELAKQDNVTSVVLGDAEAAMGCWRFADDERMLVEPACGVSLAMCYNGKLKKLLPDLSEESKVVIIVCGGSNVTLDMLSEYRRKYAYAEQIATHEGRVPSTLSAPALETNGILKSM